MDYLDPLRFTCLSYTPSSVSFDANIGAIYYIHLKS